MSLALSTLLYEWRRYLAAVIALAVAGLLVLSMTGMFMGMVRSFAAPVDRSPAEIMILPPEANSLFDHNSGQPRRLIPLIYRDPEVLEVPDVHVGQAAEIVSEADPTQVARGRVLRIAGAFGQRKLKSDAGNEATDERVVEVVISADNTPFLIGQRVLVKFMKAPAQAGWGRAGAPPPLAQRQDALQRR